VRARNGGQLTDEHTAKVGAARDEEAAEVAALRELAPKPPAPAAPARDEVAELAIQAANASAPNRGVVPGDEARSMASRAQAAGMDPKHMPAASTPEEVLLRGGMSQEELDLYKGTLNKNQQSNYQFVQKPQFKDSHPLYDVNGHMRETMTQAERMA